MPESERTRALKRERRIVMASIGAIGVLMLVMASSFDHGFWSNLAIHIGTAALVASALGFSIDYWLKREIAEDAVQAGLGYLLPDTLKAEMRAIYSNRIICGVMHQHVDIVRADADLVEVTVSIRRSLRNVGDANEPVFLSLGPEEWLVRDRPTRILEIGYRQGAKEFKNESAFKCIKNETSPGLFLTARDMPVAAPNETIDFWYRFVQTLHRNDDLYFVYRYPVERPTVQVHHGEGLAWSVSFGHHQKGSVAEVGDTVRLDATLLPYQAIIVVWWDEAAAEAWRAKKLGNYFVG